MPGEGFITHRDAAGDFATAQRPACQRFQARSVIGGHLGLTHPYIHTSFTYMQAMEQHLRARPELLPAVLTSLFELVLFEDVGNQWSLSRPMLALILVNEDIYLELQRQIIAAQPADRCTE